MSGHNFNDGGSAFPFHHPARSIVDQQLNRDGASNGMTLRDYFAAKAMASILNHPDAILLMANEKERTNAAMVAENAYAMADAMILARQPNKE